MAVSIGTLFATLRLRDVFSTQLEQAGKNLQKWSRKQERTFRRMGDTGRAMTTGITLPVAALGAAVGKTAIDFETAFTGVLKTVGDATDEFGNLTTVGETLRTGLREMALEMPITANELASIAENAGQLGIESGAILEFTQVMAKLGVTTNLSSTEAAQALARIANITEMSADDFERLGSTIVSLGNNFATNEAEIAEFGLRLAGAGNIAGMSEADFLAIGAAVASVGVKAEAGGTAISKAITKMQEAVLMGGEQLDVFAATAGMTADEFQTLFGDPNSGAANAFAMFVQGLGRQGDQALFTLKALGLDAMRTGMSMKNLAGAGELITETLENGRTAWDENIALQVEADLRFRTTASQLKMLMNNITEAALVVGDALKPAFDDVMVVLREDVLPAIKDLSNRFAALTPETQKSILTWAALVAALGPVLLVIGQVGLGITGLVGMFGGLGRMIGRFIGVLLGLGNSLIGIRVGLAALAVKAKIVALAVAAMSAPLWAWIAVIAAAGAAVYVFRDKIAAGFKHIIDWIKSLADSAAQFIGFDPIFADVPQLTEDASDGLDQVTAAFDETVAASEGMQEQTDTLARQLNNLRTQTDTVVVATQELTDAQKEAAKAQKAFEDAVSSAVDEIRGVPARARLRELISTWDKLEESEKSSVQALKFFGPELDRVTEALGPQALTGELWTAHVAFQNLNRESLPKFLTVMPSVRTQTEGVATSLTKSTSALGGFFGSFKTGFKGMLSGMTGGKNSLGGFMAQLGVGLQQGLGGILSGGLSTAISAGVGLATKGIKKLGGWIGGLFGRKSKEEKEREAAAAKAAKDTAERIKTLTAEATQGLRELTAEAQRSGELLPSHLAPYLETLREAGKITNADKLALMELAEEAHVDFEGMQSAAEKYGIELSKLGPAFDDARLRRAAIALARDWDILTKGGTDVQVVIDGMSDEVQELVNDALHAGRQIPANLRPVLDQMIQAGVLTDLEGEKLTDLSQLDFATPITQKFDELIAKISEMIDKLAGPTNSATEATAQLTQDLNNLPDPRVSIAFDYDIPDFNFGPHDVQLPGFQRGTNGFRDFGAGTPVVLHGREAVVPEGQTVPGVSSATDQALMDELNGLRAEMRTLPLHIRDAILLAN